MLKASFKRHILQFKQPSGTSRGVLTDKPSWFLRVWDEERPEVVGVGECSIIRGLSYDDSTALEEKLAEVCDRVNEGETLLQGELDEFPAAQFALETALRDLETGATKELFPSAFTSGARGIAINGLIWMGEPDFMREQIRSKIAAGFRCLKMKIGALSFDEEVALLQEVRDQYGPEELELRVDANGAFSPGKAQERLQKLAPLHLHSIEQPIRPGQPETMAELCKDSPVPVALDEELIGVFSSGEKAKLLDTVCPAYLILKPSLIGGVRGAEEWARLAEEREIPWWATSALESNIGLNAIAQWVYAWKNPLPQGLGTGQLFVNNIESPLYIDQGQLHYDPSGEWELGAVI